jgi:endonuclease-3
MDKLPFDVGVAFGRIEEAVRPWPKAALFQLAEEGHTSVFEQLLSCIILIRTFDEVTLPVSRKLFARARTPAEVAQLSFGKHICTGKRPKCSTCPVLDMCQQVGVTEHR